MASKAFLVISAMFGLSACQGAPAIAPLQPGPANPEQGPVSAVQVQAENAAVYRLAGRVLDGPEAVRHGTVAVKDVIDGRLLGAGQTDAAGGFAISLEVAPAAGLVQLVVTGGNQTLQALTAVHQPASAYSRVLQQASTEVVVNWETTLSALTMGTKITEIFLADTGERSEARRFLNEVQGVVGRLVAQRAFGNFPQVRQSLAESLEIRRELVQRCQEANRSIVDLFLRGNGPVFQLLPVTLPGEEAPVVPPAVLIDRERSTLTVTVDGRLQTVILSREVLNRSSLENVSRAAASLSAPSVTPEGAEPPAGASSPTSPTGSGSGRGGSSSGDKRYGMSIADVVLLEAGKSILGANAPASLQYAPSGTTYHLKITGRLNGNHPTKLAREDFAYPGFPFAGLIQQTFVDNQPHRRVLLDDSIFLPLDPQAAMTDTELTVLLESKSLVDLAISRLHRLSVVDREEEAVAEVRVSNLERLDNLQPEIAKAQLVGQLRFKTIKGHVHGDQGNHYGQEKHYALMNQADAFDEETETEETPQYLRVEGKNLPVGIYAHWAQINGQRVYAHACWVTDDADPTSVLFLHLPEGFVPKPRGQNQLSYANPFGFRFAAF